MGPPVLNAILKLLKVRKSCTLKQIVSVSGKTEVEVQKVLTDNSSMIKTVGGLIVWVELEKAGYQQKMRNPTYEIIWHDGERYLDFEGDGAAELKEHMGVEVVIVCGDRTLTTKALPYTRSHELLLQGAGFYPKLKSSRSRLISMGLKVWKEVDNSPQSIPSVFQWDSVLGLLTHKEQVDSSFKQATDGPRSDLSF